MQTFNRFLVLTKRILTKKAYIVMLFLILAMTIAYPFLPAKSQNAEIKVAVFSLDTSSHNIDLKNHLEKLHSLYEFYYVDTREALINDVKSGEAECGYVISENFFDDYIRGTAYNNPITQYVIPSSALASVITETLFSSILTICSNEVLEYAANIPEYNEEMNQRLNYYLESDEIFTIKDTTSGEFKYEESVFRINLPILEVTIILLIFSGLLGLLVFMQDKEKGIYKALSEHSMTQLKLLSIVTSILPVLLAGLVGVAVSYGLTISILWVILAATASILTGFLLSFIIKKSTHLEKVLPLIMLVCIFAIFAQTLI